MLGLPLNADARDVERKSRILARSAHPDKVAPHLQQLRARAEWQFRALQEAKATALAWLKTRPDSTLRPGFDASSDEADESGSDNGEHLNEMKACGLDPE